MKIRYHFEPEDFNSGGQMIVRNSFQAGSDNYLFGVSVAYKVGYIINHPKNKICMISLSDGMVTNYDSEELLCERLNDDTFGFRPMSTDEIKQILGAQGARFQ